MKIIYFITVFEGILRFEFNQTLTTYFSELPGRIIAQPIIIFSLVLKIWARNGGVGEAGRKEEKKKTYSLQKAYQGVRCHDLLSKIV